jgi:hypothetical protein
MGEKVILRLLLLTPQLPYPPHQGTTMRNFNLMVGLARRHEIHLLSFVTPDDDLSSAYPLKEICQAIYTVHPQGQTETIAQEATL